MDAVGPRKFLPLLPFVDSYSLSFGGNMFSAISFLRS